MVDSPTPQSNETIQAVVITQNGAIVLNRGGSGTQAPPAESLPAPKNFLQKRLSQKGYPPFVGQNHFWTGFCQRGHEQFSEQTAAFLGILAEHFIRRPVRARFTNGADALNDCANWLGAGGARIMLVTGGPGAGKSVFALSLASEIHALFSREQN